MIRRQRGIAIVMAMLISTLMVVMMGAFFQVNRDNLTSFQAHYRQKQAYLAAVAGLQHARIMIEHDQNWGKADFTGATKTLANDVILTEVNGTRRFEGQFLGTRDGQSFEVLVYNNLGLNTSSTTVNSVKVPGDAIKLRVTARVGGFESRLMVTYSGEPLYDSSAVSQGELDMSRASKWILQSKDPRRNWVRSNTGITTPDILSPASAVTSPMTFDNSLTGSKIRGVAWSRGDIKAKQGTNLVDVTTDLSKAELNSNGLMAPKSNLRNDIYKMGRTDLKFPSAARSIPAGRYVISDVKLDFKTDYLITDDDTDDAWWESNWGDDKDAGSVASSKALKTLTYFPPSGAPVVYYRTDELNALVNQVKTEASAKVNPLAGKGDVAMVAPPTFTPPGGTAWGASKLPLNSAGFDFDFDSNTFSLDGDFKYDIDGDFEVGYNFSNASTGNSDTFSTYRPKVVFKGGTAGSTAIDVKGKVDLSATVEGKAAIAADKDIQFMSGADATATVNQPLVVYSGGSINIVAVSEVQNNFKLKGLIYADNDFNLLKESSGSPLNDVTFEGAIVAQSGKIDMGDANKVTFLYDSTYIEAFTHGLPQNRRRLKQAAFVIL